MKNIMMLLLMLVYTGIRAQNNDNSIIINGELDSASLIDVKKDPTIWFYDFYNKQLHTPLADKIDLNIEGLTFKSSFTPKENFGYFVFNGKYIGSIFWNVFFVERGDKITIDLSNKGDAYFKGIGAEKLNYQATVAQHLKLNFAPFKDFNDTRKIGFYKKKRDSILKLSLDLLEKDKGKWSKAAHEILMLNTIGRINNQYMTSLLSAKKFNDQKYLSLVETELNELLAYRILESKLYKYAPFYTKYLFDLNVELIALQTLNSPDFKGIYSKIKKEYSGRFREQLIFYAFLTLFKDFDDKDNLLKEILSFLKDEEYIDWIKNKTKLSLSGAPAFNFEFLGYDGKMIKLDDFKGKVVVMDTWFLGCAGCEGLTKYMEPIIEHFNGRKDVVFLGINVDKDKVMFRRGVDSGRYGSKQTIYAYTNGLGSVHPMLLYYQYKGYPNLLLIDKQGKIITTKPAKPTSVQKKIDFINLIEKHL